MKKDDGKGTVWCGCCFKKFSANDWPAPAAALEQHYLTGECPKAKKA